MKEAPNNSIQKNALVIIGVTGDLSTKKLFPAIWHGHQTGRFEKVKVVGVGRRDWSPEDFNKFAENSCQPQDPTSSTWKKFCSGLTYVKSDFINEDLSPLSKVLQDCKGIIYFLATPPEAFPILAEKLSKIKVKGFKRLVVEKPFGKDLHTAEKLNTQTKIYFKDQVYRIDHYLGKGMVRNLQTLRYSNEVFRNIWNKDNIESVNIIQSEKTGVETRTEYYDQTGAIRDMIQSHLLQLLALVAMNETSNTKNSFLLKSQTLLKLKKPDSSDVVIGQYASYEKDVGHSSTTESFASIRAFLNIPEWKDVPFYLQTGKKLDENFAKIVIKFKKTKFNPLAPANSLEIMLSPEERVKFTFNLHDHDLNTLKPFSMEYCMSCEFRPNTPTAYEKLILDALNGDKSLYASWAEIRASWKYADKLLEASKANKLFIYQNGSKGPLEQVEKLHIEA